MKKLLFLAVLMLCSTCIFCQDDTTTTPIIITDFKYDHEIRSLTWKVESEVNFSHYEIERSMFNISAFEKIGETLNPPFRVDLLTGNNYFRMKMVDLDGTFSHSLIIEAIDKETLFLEALRLGEYYDVNGQKTSKRTGALIIVHKGQSFKIYRM